MYIYSISVNRVIDGDTISADIDLGFKIFLKDIRVRLANIDCPESRSRDTEERQFALKSKYFLSQLLTSKAITLESHGKDKFGRVLGILFADGEAVNTKMVEANHAVAYNGENKQSIKQAHLANRLKLTTANS
jgi:micrococcal nuclease